MGTIVVVLCIALVGVAAWGHHARLSGYRRTRAELARSTSLINAIRREAATHQQISPDPLSGIVLNLIANHDDKEIS